MIPANENDLPDSFVDDALPRLLVAIVNRSNGERTTALLKGMHFHFLLSCMGEGTAGKGLADLMGFGPSDKTILICIAPGIRTQLALTELDRMLHLKKANRGIAFTIPLSGIGLPERVLLDKEKIAHIQKKIEGGVEKMLDCIKNELILAVVNQGYSEALMECAQSAKVTGGTVLNARNLGADHAAHFFGEPLQAERQIVAILVSREIQDAAMTQIKTFFKENPKARGTLLSLPVDHVVGLGE